MQKSKTVDRKHSFRASCCEGALLTCLFVRYIVETQLCLRLLVPVLTTLIRWFSGGTKPLLSAHSLTFNRFLVISVPHLSSLLTGKSQQGVSAFQSTCERFVVTCSHDTAMMTSKALSGAAMYKQELNLAVNLGIRHRNTCLFGACHLNNATKCIAKRQLSMNSKCKLLFIAPGRRLTVCRQLAGSLPS